MLGFKSEVRRGEVEFDGLQWSETARSERTDPELQLFEKQSTGWRWETRSVAIAVRHLKTAVREFCGLRQILIVQRRTWGREWQEGCGRSAAIRERTTSLLEQVRGGGARLAGVVPSLDAWSDRLAL